MCIRSFILPICFEHTHTHTPSPSLSLWPCELHLGLEVMVAMAAATAATVRHSIKLSVRFWIYVHRFILDSLHKLRLMVFYIYYVYLDGFCCWHLSRREKFCTISCKLCVFAALFKTQISVKHWTRI